MRVMSESFQNVPSEGLPEGHKSLDHQLFRQSMQSAIEQALEGVPTQIRIPAGQKIGEIRLLAELRSIWETMAILFLSSW